MTLILTAPQRIALMCYDSHPSIKTAFQWHQNKIDPAWKPCWVVRHDSTSYPTYASENEEPQETYILDYIGQNFTLNCQQEYEALAREVADAAIRYFLSHPQLQFSNDRHDTRLAQLPPLPSVKYARPESLSSISLMQRLGIDEAFWGFTINLNVTEVLDYDEVLVPDEI